MNTTDRDLGREYAKGPRPTQPRLVRIGFWLLLAIAAFYLFTEHRAHLLAGAWLPLILLACPLMHLIMHRGHGGHGAHRRGKSVKSDSQSLPRSLNSSRGRGDAP